MHILTNKCFYSLYNNNNLVLNSFIVDFSCIRKLKSLMKLDLCLKIIGNS